MLDLISNSDFLTSSLSAFFAVLSLAFVLLASRIVAKLYGFEQNYKIAIFGLPRSGKTTLITTLFYRLMTDSLSRRVSVSGEGTLRRITDYIEAIRSGANLGPTTDGEVFSFRFRYRRPNTYFPPFNFDVEIADFPGEYSSDFSERAVESMSIERVEAEIAKVVGEVDENEIRDAVFAAVEGRRKSRKSKKKVSNKVSIRESVRDLSRMYASEFQGYLSGADKYIIVLDVENIFKNIDIVDLLEAKIFASIMSLRDGARYRSNDLAKKDVAIVYSKCDIISNEEIFDAVISGNSNGHINFRTASKYEFSQEFFDKKIKEINEMFRETEKVLGANFRQVGIFFHSSYMRKEHFLDVEDNLVRFLLP